MFGRSRDRVKKTLNRDKWGKGTEEKEKENRKEQNMEVKKKGFSVDAFCSIVVLVEPADWHKQEG